jgi:glycosyltransferase involved in cell wall biosynthesis
MGDVSDPKDGLGATGLREIKQLISDKDKFEKFELVTMSQMQESLENFHALKTAFMFNLVELQTTMKPYAFQFTFQERGASAVLYIDNDIWVTDSLEEIQHHLSHRSSVLTPHYSSPIPEDGKKQKDKDVLASGVFNFGFVAFSNTASTAKFLEFWAERLSLYGFAVIEKEMFYDQNWGMFIPAFFDHEDYYVIRDLRYNIAYWNLHERGAGLHMKEDGLPYLENAETNEDQKVVFMHFSGMSLLEKYDIEGISRHQNRFTLKNFPRIEGVFNAYMALVEEHNTIHYRMFPYGYSKFSDGSGVSQWMRDLYAAAVYPVPKYDFEVDLEPPYKTNLSPYLRLWFQNRVFAHDPFCASKDCSGDSTKKTLFQSWMWDVFPESAVDLEGAFYISQVEKSIWNMRKDVQKVIPDPLGANFQQYRKWFTQSALNEKCIDEGSFKRWNDRINYHRKNHTHFHTLIKSEHEENIGINILGWHAGQFSIGISGANIVRSALASDISVNAIELGMCVSHKFRRPEHLGFELSRSISNPINLFVVNAAEFSYPLNDIPPILWEAKYNIGYWAWELDVFKSEWIQMLGKVDEVWCPSHFVKNSIESSPEYAKFKTPVKVVPIPLEPQVDETKNDAHDDNRSEVLKQVFEANEQSKPFVFLTAFDFHSIKARKNPEAVIKAFLEAFPIETDTGNQYQLIVKTHHGSSYDIQEMKALTINDPRILFINELLSDYENKQLYKHQDCYVSLHRSEGFGMIILETLANGIPVIATDYSGNVDFFSVLPEMKNKCVFPVDYALVELEENHGPYSAGNHWANPDNDKAVKYMRQVVMNDCKNIYGTEIAKQIESEFGAKAVGEKIKKMILESLPVAYAKQKKVQKKYKF